MRHRARLRYPISFVYTISLLSQQVNSLPSADDIFLRDTSTTCTTAGSSPCNLAGFPSNFCCPSTTTCFGINNTQTVICCPTGSSCSFIEPITCDTSQQNATLFPDNSVHSTNLSATLATCGSMCCPQGFTCQGGTLCALQEDETSISASASPSSTPSSTAVASLQMSASVAPSITASTSSISVSTTPTVTPATSNSGVTSDQNTQTCSKFPAGAIAAGLFPGLAAGSLLTLAAVCCLGRNKGKRRPPSPLGGAGVSQPMTNPAGGGRSDFLRRNDTPTGDADRDGNASGNGFSNRMSRLSRVSSMTRVRSLFSPRTPPPLVPQVNEKDQDVRATKAFFGGTNNAPSPDLSEVDLDRDLEKAAMDQERERQTRQMQDGLGVGNILSMGPGYTPNSKMMSVSGISRISRWSDLDGNGAEMGEINVGLSPPTPVPGLRVTNAQNGQPQGLGLSSRGFSGLRVPSTVTTTTGFRDSTKTTFSTMMETAGLKKNNDTYVPPLPKGAAELAASGIPPPGPIQNGPEGRFRDV